MKGLFIEIIKILKHLLAAFIFEVPVLYRAFKVKKENS